MPSLPESLLDQVDLLVVELTPEGKIAYLSPALARALDREARSLLGQDWCDLCLPPDVTHAVRSVFDGLLGGDPNALDTYSYPLLTSRNERLRVTWKHAAIRGHDGRVSGVAAFGWVAELPDLPAQALDRRTKDLLDMRYALDQAAIVAATDVRGIIQYANRKFCEISGYAEHELLGQDHRIVNSGHHPKSFMRELWRTIASGEVWRGEIKNRAKDGHCYWVDTTIVPFLDRRGHPYRYLAIRYDITQRKQAEERLRQQAALAQLGQMAAVVAHEVKNPLAAISGAIQVLHARTPAESPHRVIFSEITTRIGALADTLRDLLEFARPRVARLGAVELRPLLEETAALVLKDEALRRTCVNVSGDAPEVDADGELLGQAFLNLLLNAAQAMDGRGSIEVTLAAFPTRTEVRVADTGPGVPPEARERLGEPFYTTKTRGSGLGLAVVRRTLEAHGGSLSFEFPEQGGTVAIAVIPRRA